MLYSFSDRERGAAIVCLHCKIGQYQKQTFILSLLEYELSLYVFWHFESKFSSKFFLSKVVKLMGSQV